jgi:hypothetical protein
MTAEVTENGEINAKFDGKVKYARLDVQIKEDEQHGDEQSTASATSHTAKHSGKPKNEKLEQLNRD